MSHNRVAKTSKYLIFNTTNFPQSLTFVVSTINVTPRLASGRPGISRSVLGVALEMSGISIVEEVQPLFAPPLPTVTDDLEVIYDGPST